MSKTAQFLLSREDEDTSIATEWFGNEIPMSQTPDSCSIPTRILLPMDFSPSSYKALEMATDLAEHFHAELYLVNVIPLLPTVTGAEFFSETEFLQETRDQAEQQLAISVGALVSRALKVSSSVETGNDVAGNIMIVIEREHIDMVILSTHGISGWRPMVFGSIAEKVVRLVQCPLLLLRSAAPAILEVSTQDS
jgi:nucleotide-binding universal stress UspA family protein